MTLTDVSRAFGRRRALLRVSLTCTAGEIVGLLGPNGAGKSTLLAVLGTLLTPSSGEVRYGASLAKEVGAALRRRLGLLAHDLFLYADLSARENLEFFGRLYGLHDVTARVDAALDGAGLRSRADDPVSGFSRGMRQRLALERTLLHEPRLVLLDEPFTGLDEPSATALVSRLQTLRGAGAIIVLATHDLERVDELLDRAAVLTDGRLALMEPSQAGWRVRYRDALARKERPA